MDSSENASWSQVKQRLFAGAPSQQRDIRFWACRTRAAGIIRSLGAEVEADAAAIPEIRVGDCGVCRHRHVRLGINPAEFDRNCDRMSFGALYTVEEISRSKGWIRIRLPNDRSGWIESRLHFGISSGEHKVLASLKRTNTLNFLINAIAATPL